MRSLLAVAVAVLVTLAGCYAEPQRQSTSTNNDVNVALLTEFDGCKVYRFWDGGRAIYVARCGAEATVDSAQSCGKGCVDYGTTITTEAGK